MTRWHHFPKSTPPPGAVLGVVDVFKGRAADIDSATRDLKSDEVLGLLAPGLLDHGFRVEAGKGGGSKVSIPVLFGENGSTKKSFDVDAHHPIEKVVVEVEAGRGYTNHQFLKDLFEACVMVDTDYLVIAVRKTYKGVKDYENVVDFFETLYASQKLKLPLTGVTVIGY